MPSDKPTLAQLSPLVGELIHEMSGARGRWVRHDEIVSALLGSQPFTDHLSGRIDARTSGKRPEWYAGIAVAWFSRLYTTGALAGAERFERVKDGEVWAYRRAWGPPPPLADTVGQPAVALGRGQARRCRFCGTTHADDAWRPGHGASHRGG